MYNFWEQQSLGGELFVGEPYCNFWDPGNWSIGLYQTHQTCTIEGELPNQREIISTTNAVTKYRPLLCCELRFPIRIQICD
jgi:hypothetical protein